MMVYKIYYPQINNCPVCKTYALFKCSTIKSKHGWLRCNDCGYIIKIGDTDMVEIDTYENGELVREDVDIDYFRKSCS
jgi:transcription elongation factor Elf1